MRPGVCRRSNDDLHSLDVNLDRSGLQACPRDMYSQLLDEAPADKLYSDIDIVERGAYIVGEIRRTP